MNLDFNEIFKYTVFHLKKNGCDPYRPRNIKWIVQFCLYHGLNTLVILSLVYSAIFYDIKNDKTQACANSTLIVMYAVVTLMYLLIVKHQDLMRILIDKIKEDYEVASNSLPSDEKVLVEIFARKGQWCAHVWGFLCFMVFCSFFMRSVPSMIYYALISDFKLVEFYPVTYVPCIQNNKYNLVPFCSIYFSWVFMAYYMGSIYSSVVPLAPIFMLHACGRLEILKKRVMQLFSEEESFSFQEREEKLKIIIKELQDVYDFVKKIQVGFMFLYEVILKGACIIMPVMLYEILDTINKREVRPEFFTLFGATVVLSAIPCLYGDMLTEHGESFKNTLYSCNWERQWDKQTRVTLILMLTRTQLSIAVRAVFREINRDALADVYRQAYTLFNFMIASFGI